MTRTSVPVRVDEAQLAGHARRLAARLPAAACIHLAGELGAGKTTFVRALLDVWQPGLRVRSPTYALVERYRIAGREVLHADLYRLRDPAELEALGLREALGQALLLIEWPERGGGQVPPADLGVRLTHAGEARGLSYVVPAAPPDWLGDLWPGDDPAQRA